LAKNIPVAAVDLGAESGRVLLIRFDGTHFEQHELHRFPNTPHTVEGRLSWNWSALQGEISKGLALAAPHSPVSVGVDTWGVDQALLDEAGNLLLEPIHYRDVGRNSPQNAASLIEKTPLDEIFRATGIQNMTINTLYLFHWYAQHMPELLERAATSLYMPDLINFWLSGVRVNEYTNATTSQMLNPATGRYATQLLDKLNIPTHIFPAGINTRRDYTGSPAQGCHADRARDPRHRKRRRRDPRRRCRLCVYFQRHMVAVRAGIAPRRDGRTRTGRQRHE
jgi:rhamnulokinase